MIWPCRGKKVSRLFREWESRLAAFSLYQMKGEGVGDWQPVRRYRDVAMGAS